MFDDLVELKDKIEKIEKQIELAKPYLENAISLIKNEPIEKEKKV